MTNATINAEFINAEYFDTDLDAEFDTVLDAVLDRADAPDLSHYRAIHEAMRTSNQQLVDALDEMSALDKGRAMALCRWFQGYDAELKAHHHIEDDICFPDLADRVPEFADYYSASLADDHHHLDDVIEALGAAMARLASFDGDENDRVQALALAVELRDFLLEHLAVEDHDVLPMFERFYTVDEYEVLNRRILKDIDPRQAFFAAPWFMANVPAATRQKTYRDAPLALKIVYRLGRGRYDRIAQVAFGAPSVRSAS